jgi:hypothetical protein
MFLHIFSWKRFISPRHSEGIDHQKRYLSRNVFDESLSSEPVSVRWNLRFQRHLLETTHVWFIVITIISTKIAPPFVHKFPLLIVYKKKRILTIGAHYGLSVWCGYTFAKSENKQFSKLRYQFFWHVTYVLKSWSWLAQDKKVAKDIIFYHLMSEYAHVYMYV